MRPYYDEAGITIYHGDCLEELVEDAAELEIDMERVKRMAGRAGSWTDFREKLEELVEDTRKGRA